MATSLLLIAAVAAAIAILHTLRTRRDHRMMLRGNAKNLEDDVVQQIFIYVNIPLFHELEVTFPQHASVLVERSMSCMHSALRSFHSTVSIVKYAGNDTVLLITTSVVDGMAFSVAVHRAMACYDWGSVLPDSDAQLSGFYRKLCGARITDDATEDGLDGALDGGSAGGGADRGPIEGSESNSASIEMGERTSRALGRPQAESASDDEFASFTHMHMRVGMCMGSFERTKSADGRIDYFGDAVNIASSLMRSTAPGRTLLVFSAVPEIEASKFDEVADINCLGSFSLAGCQAHQLVFEVSAPQRSARFL